MIPILQKIGKLLPKKYYCQDTLFTGNTFVKPYGFDESYARGCQAVGGQNYHNHWRVAIAIWAAKQAQKVAGDYVELGVNYGVTSSAILHNLKTFDRKFFLVDSFDGVSPLPSRAKATGAYNCSFERTRDNFSEWPSAEVIKGWLPACLDCVKAGSIAYLHIDLNSAQPEIQSYLELKPRLSPGAIVLLDDYCYAGYQETQKAWDSLNANILCMPTGQGMLVN